jgi:chromosome segregation ATPase
LEGTKEELTRKIQELQRKAASNEKKLESMKAKLERKVAESEAKIRRLRAGKGGSNGLPPSVFPSDEGSFGSLL